jgi:palmitoyltransferase ZDHHC2/15/20
MENLSFLLAVLNLAFTLSVLGFMCMHMSLVSANTTTIEASISFNIFHVKYATSKSDIFTLKVQAYEKKTTAFWKYDLGRKRNFTQVRLVQVFIFILKIH